MIYWVWLQQCLGYGSVRFNEFLHQFKSPFNLYKTDNASIKSCNIFTPAEIRKIIQKDLIGAKDIIRKCKERNISIVTYEDTDFPENLKNIDSPPIVLYVDGKLPDFDNIPSICIVGPRNVSEFGYKSAYSIAGRLAKSGFTVVSGGAVGSDAAAHLGALKNDGKTVAFLACGIGYDYLKENKNLRELIRKNSCLISEFPPDFPVMKNSFKIRNRLMSGITLGTVIVEAKEHGGTLITASYAVNQGKDVFVIPGNPTLDNYKGSNALLRDGAKPLIDLRDVFDEYIRRFPDKIDIAKAYASPLKRCEIPKKVNKTAVTEDKHLKTDRHNSDENKESSKEKTEKISKKSTVGLSKFAEIVYNRINTPEFFPDDLISKELDNSAVMSALGELELFGYIKSLPGGRYSLL